MKSYLVPVYFRISQMSQSYLSDKHPIPKALQTIYVVNAESKRERIVCPLRFRGSNNLCYCRGVKMGVYWNPLLQRTIRKFREDEYRSYGIYKFHSYYNRRRD